MDFMFIQYLSSINFFAVFVSAIISFGLGSLWFSCFFGKIWLKELEKNNIIKKQPTPAELKTKMILTSVGNLIASFDMVLLVHAIGSTTLCSGLQLGVLVAVGFITTAMGISYVWASRSLILSVIDIGYPATACILSAILLSLWQ